MISSSPSLTSPSAPLTLRIPSDQIYWCRLATGAAKRAITAQLYRFERMLPVPIEELQWTHARVSGEESLFIAIEPQRLRQFLAGAATSGEPWKLIPERLPEHLRSDLEADGGEQLLTRLNLLHGRFEPAQRRRLRRILWLAVHAGLGLLVMALLVGAERRASWHRRASLDAGARSRALIAQVFAQQGGTGNRPELAEPRLIMEVRRLEQALDATRAAAGVDVIALLQDLWRRWPKDLLIQVDGLSIGPERIALNAKVPSLADAERLSSACAEIAAPGVRFRADPLQAQMSDGQATVALSWMRMPAAGAPGAAP